MLSMNPNCICYHILSDCPSSSMYPYYAYQCRHRYDPHLPSPHKHMHSHNQYTHLTLSLLCECIDSVQVCVCVWGGGDNDCHQITQSYIKEVGFVGGIDFPCPAALQSTCTACDIDNESMKLHANYHLDANLLSMNQYILQIRYHCCNIATVTRIYIQQNILPITRLTTGRPNIIYTNMNI